MSAGMRFGGRFGRGLGLCLATFALIVGLLTPPGFMIAPTDHGAAVVICTGHGPLLGVRDLGHSGKPAKSSTDGVCAFAGHGAAPPAQLAYIAVPIRFASPPRLAKALIDQTPGRGLVAPPPPSQGPPVRL